MGGVSGYSEVRLEWLSIRREGRSGDFLKEGRDCLDSCSI